MSILKDFDIAIADVEKMPRGYKTDNGTYDSYLRNDVWNALLTGMSAEHRGQYGDGSGGELKEKNNRPPKMASFASSSRMTYMLSKDIPGFVFEKQLSTVIGGIANLDGYWEGNSQHIFVEAKRREPYSHKSPQIIKRRYEPLYTYLQEKLLDSFSCEMEKLYGTENMRVAFFSCGKEVVYFDVKQMLCHLLGVANRALSSGACDTPIQFLYLLYNPMELSISPESRDEILEIYKITCQEALGYDFRKIFACVVDFLMREKKYPIADAAVEKLKENFRFALCDQNDYKDYF